jgi:hypothetical protein
MRKLINKYNDNILIILLAIFFFISNDYSLGMFSMYFFFFKILYDKNKNIL